MDSVSFDRAGKILEALEVVGQITVHIDSSPPICLSFTKSLRVLFDLKPLPPPSTSNDFSFDVCVNERALKECIALSHEGFPSTTTGVHAESYRRRGLESRKASSLEGETEKEEVPYGSDSFMVLDYEKGEVTVVKDQSNHDLYKIEDGMEGADPCTENYEEQQLPSNDPHSDKHQIRQKTGDLSVRRKYKPTGVKKAKGTDVDIPSKEAIYSLPPELSFMSVKQEKVGCSTNNHMDDASHVMDENSGVAGVEQGPSESTILSARQRFVERGRCDGEIHVSPVKDIPEKDGWLKHAKLSRAKIDKEGSESKLKFWPVDAITGQLVAGEVVEILKQEASGEGTFKAVEDKDKDQDKDQYKCLFCSRIFMNRAEITAHHRNPHSLQQCRKCGVDFLCEADLFVHQHSTYPLEYVASQYPSFTVQAWSQKGNCPLCSAIYGSVHSAGTHLKNAHFTDKSFICCVCDCNFTTLQKLKFHLSTRHPYDRELAEKEMGIRALSSQSSQGKTASTEKGSQSQAVSAMTSSQKERTRIDMSCTHKRNVDEVSKDPHEANVASKAKKVSVEGVRKGKKANSDAAPAVSSKHARTCKFCGKMFKSPLALKQHTNMEPSKIKCTKCQRTFPSQADVIYHDVKVHLSSPNMPPRIVKGERIIMSKLTVVSCPICAKEMKLESLRDHIGLAHTKEDRFQCCLCGQTFPSRRQLMKHSNEHGNERKRDKGSIHCSLCPEVFYTRADFGLHSATAHRATCLFCQQDFTHPRLLDHHLKSQHPHRLLSCKTCGKKVPTRLQLINHEKHHRYSAATPCPFCGLMIQSRYLKAHMARHQQHQCSKCPRKLQNKRALLYHLRTDHGGKDAKYTCPICHKMLSSRNVMLNHVFHTHLGGARCTCEICGKQFSSAYNLKVHMRSHSSVKHFFCHVCNQGFNYKSILKSHLKSRHPDVKFTL